MNARASGQPTPAEDVPEDEGCETVERLNDRLELTRAVINLRARDPLTERQRALVRKRGRELVEGDLCDETPADATAEELAQPDLDAQEEDELFEDEVLAEADAAEGRTGISREELFERLRAIG